MPEDLHADLDARHRDEMDAYFDEVEAAAARHAHLFDNPAFNPTPHDLVTGTVETL